ncbi:MAG: transposase [Spirochaetales bacterium]|nr:transposase [Spirochaetales bacterium]
MEENIGEPTRYKKILYEEEAIDNYCIEKFIESKQGEKPQKIILDVDATDDPLHGEQQGRFFHGYHDCYCYLPLYIFCGDDLLCAKLKTVNLDPGNEATGDIRRVVNKLVSWSRRRPKPASRC